MKRTFSARDFSYSCAANSDFGNTQHRTTILPLPAGEGRGEGEGSASLRLLASERIGALTSSCHSPSPLIPLPLGEGNDRRAFKIVPRHSANSDSGNVENWWVILPLPAGEGRGEGEPARRGQASASSKTSRKLLFAALVAVPLVSLAADDQSPPDRLGVSYRAAFNITAKIRNVGSS